MSIPISADGSTAWARIPTVSSVSVIQTSGRPVQATVNSLFKISLCPPSARAYKANRRSPGCTSTPVKYQMASGSLTIIWGRPSSFNACDSRSRRCLCSSSISNVLLYVYNVYSLYPVCEKMQVVRPGFRMQIVRFLLRKKKYIGEICLLKW